MGPLVRWSFVILMLGLTALFIALGVWQLERLAEKQALIERVETRMVEPETPFPPASDWSGLDATDLDYRAFSATGTFDNAHTVLVFQNLSEARGRYKGVGYWVFAPLHLDDGGILWVNRGFVPEALADQFADGGDAPGGVQTVAGVARRPERGGSFTPEPDLDARRDWLRAPASLSLVLPQGDGPVAPVTLDMAAGEPGALPQGGETEVSFSNRHLEYALTWFAFAGITPVMLIIWFLQRRRRDAA